MMVNIQYTPKIWLTAGIFSMMFLLVISWYSGCTQVNISNGTIYEVMAGGSVIDIAGTNILFETGTKVNLGGYLWGHIYMGSWCLPPNPILAPVFTTGGVGNQVTEAVSNSFFRIYPNPSPGKFTLELKGDVPATAVHVEIFGILGDRILTREMVLDRKQEFSLAVQPTGVYVIHVISGLNSVTEKIIKR